MLLKEAKGKPTTSYSPFLNHFNAVIKKQPIKLARKSSKTLSSAPSVQHIIIF